MKNFETAEGRTYLFPYVVVPIFEDYIKMIERTNNIKSGDLRLELAMHLFKYSLDEIFSDGEYYNPMYVNEDVVVNKIIFKEVDAKTGFLIQDELHYINTR